MTPTYRYFMIPYTSVPMDPPYTVWFATWTKDPTTATWSTERPDAALTASTTWAVGVTAGDIPAEGTLLGTATKDPPPPPMAITSLNTGTALKYAWFAGTGTQGLWLCDAALFDQLRCTT